MQAGGAPVRFLGRPRVLDELRAHGLTLTDYGGTSVTLPPDDLILSDDPVTLAGAGLVLVTVKSGATGEIAAAITAHAPSSAPVISLQNGVEAARLLVTALPDRDVRAGMVPYNVVPLGQGRFHRATSGDIVIGDGPVPLAAQLNAPHLTVQESDAIAAIQWGKLVVNLNNAINALSGLTLFDLLLRRDWRRVMADQMAEALAVLKAAGIAVQGTTPVPMGWVPHILRLPTPLFRRIAAQMLTVDPAARTSMAYDLEAGRPTEIAALQGQIIALGRAHGVPTPHTTRIAALIEKASAKGATRPALTPAQVGGLAKADDVS